MNDSIKKAIPVDSIYLPGFFYTTDIAFAASCCLLNRKVTLQKVIFHPQRVGQKVYYLSPEAEAKQTYFEYSTGQLRVDPKLLQGKIHDLKYLFADKCPTKDSFPTVDSRYKPKSASYPAITNSRNGEIP